MDIENKDSISERMKKIREESVDNSYVELAMGHPNYIHRPSAPRVSADAAKPMDDTQVQKEEQKPLEKTKEPSLTEEQQDIVQAIQSPFQPKEASQVAQSMTSMREKAQDQAPAVQPMESPVSLSKPKQEVKEEQTTENGYYHGHKLTDEQREIVQGIMVNQTKGNALANIATMRMKHGKSM